jgi:Caspase domain
MRRYLTAMLGVIGCLAGCLAGSLLAATPAAAERRVALVVGNAEYAYTPALPNPRNDAGDIANSLKKVGFEVMLGHDLDQVKFARLIDDFARALEGADVGLFFYAGHGLQISEKNYLVSTEARLESTFLVPSETIEVNAVIRLMESKTETNLVFLDACRNNPLTDNLKRNLAAVNRTVTVGRGLARVEPTGRDTLVAFSAAPGQEAADGRGRNSPFTAALLRHLPKPGLEVSVMLKEVTADVRRDTSNAQRPQQLSDMSKTFYFVNAAPDSVAAPPAVAATPPAAPADRVDQFDAQFWQSAEAARECEPIRAYLRQFPNGRFIELARLAERRLCRTGPEFALPQPPPGPAPASASGPAPVAPSTGAATNVAIAVPAAAPPAVPAAPPAANVIEVGRKLQKELARVGCAVSGMETDGTWGGASRTALRSFNERTRSVAEIDRPTPEALEAVQSRKDRICPIACEPGTELHGTSCVAAPRPLERSRRATRSPERERSRSARPLHQAAEPARADAGSQALRRGETWTYQGNKRCKAIDAPGSPPRIVCP